MSIVALKFSAAAGAVGLLAVAITVANRISADTHERLARYDVAVMWLLTRLVPIIGIYCLAGFAPESDVATCFWPQAAGALSGHVPYRDFESFFGPLFPYLLAVPVALWHDPRALIVWMTLLEAATIALTLRAAGLGQPGRIRTRFLLCAFVAPGPLFLEVIGGQEDFLLWTFGVLGWLALHRGKWGFAAIVMIAGILCTKALFLLPIAAFLAITPSRGKSFAVLAVAGLAVFGTLRMLTGDAFLAVLKEGGNISPPQIWLLLHFLSGGAVPSGSATISFAVIGILIVGAFVYAQQHSSRLKESWSAFAAYWVTLFALLIVLSPKSQGAYVGYILLPALPLVLQSRLRLTLWIAVGFLAVTLPSVFYRLGEPQPTSRSDITTALGAVNIVGQFAFVTALIWLAVLGWRQLRDFRPALSEASRTR